MDGSEKEEMSSDMRTSTSLPKDLGSGGKTTNVFPPLTSPPVSDQAKYDPGSNLQSSTSDGSVSLDREQLSRRNPSTTDHDRTRSLVISTSSRGTDVGVNSIGSDDRRTSNPEPSACSPRELDRGEGRTHVIPPLSSPPVSDHLKDEPISDPQSLIGDIREPSSEQLRQSHLSNTDQATENSFERDTLPLHARSVAAENDIKPELPCDDLKTFSFGTSIGLPDKLNRGGETFNVVPPLTSTHASRRGKEDPVANWQSSTRCSAERRGKQQCQSRPSTTDQTTTSSTEGSSLPQYTGGEAKNNEIQPVNQAADCVSGDRMQDHASITDPNARYEALVIEGLTAIEKKDCKALLMIVGEARTKFQDRVQDMFRSMSIKNLRTALHVSAMQGCFPLAKMVLDLVKDWSELKAGGHDREDYIERVDPESGLTAFQMVFDITGNRSIAEYIKYTLQTIRHTPISEQIYPFYEAYARTRSWNVLQAYCTDDENTFSSLELHWNSRLLLETFNGLTVLHVAILLNDLAIVKEVMKIFGFQKKVVWGDSYYPSSLSWDQMLMLPEKKWVNRLPEVSKLNNTSRTTRQSKLRQLQKSISRSERILKPKDTALELAKKLGFSDIAAELNHFGKHGTILSATDDQFCSDSRSKVERAMSDLPEFDDKVILTTTTIISELKLENDWEKGFLDDVDFNFEKEPRLYALRFHYLCKDPFKFKDILKIVSNDGRLDSFNLNSTWYIFDGQGRSPFHIFLDCLNDGNQVLDLLEEMLIIESKGDSKFYDYVNDNKGRSLLHVLILKHYIYNFPKLWHHNDGMRYLKNIPYSLLLCSFQLALHMKQSKFATMISKKILQDHTPFDVSQIHPLLISASYGNQAILRLILDASSNPMVTDNKKRTALHHAADASLLDPPYTNGHFYSTVEDLCKDKKMWKEREMMGGFVKADNESISSFSNVDNISNVERKACILMLVQAGVDLFEADNEGKVPNVGPSVDASLQSWWYDMVVKVATDNKNSFNQAGNALSVVGTLVAATSYVGPLQPPMNYIEGGFVHMGEKLIEIFMVTNTLAFYFAMASVMFAVVPSLPMPREGVMSELKRARHTVSLSLCFLLIATSMIIISFAAASIAVIHDQQSFHRSDLLFIPSIIGWSICLFASLAFLLRVVTLIHYKNPTIRNIYQLSLTEFCKKVWIWWKYYFIYFSFFFSKVFEQYIEIFSDIIEDFDYNMRTCLGHNLKLGFRFFINAIVTVVLFLCFPICHCIYIFRNFDKLDKQHKDEKARLLAARMQRSMLL